MIAIVEVEVEAGVGVEVSKENVALLVTDGEVGQAAIVREIQDQERMEEEVGLGDEAEVQVLIRKTRYNKRELIVEKLVLDTKMKAKKIIEKK